MIASLATAVTAGFSIFCYFRIRRFYGFIKEAKSTGLPYVTLPFYPFNAFWLFAQPVFIPLLDCLPKKFTRHLLPLLPFIRGWQDGYEPFQLMGCDTYLVVSPTGNICYTSDPQLTHQLLRSNIVDKPVESLAILNVFGPTMTGTSNRQSRVYRKITTPFFNERTMQNLWDRSLEGAQAALKVWMKGRRSTSVCETRPVLARLSIYLINAVCFGGGADPVLALQDQDNLPNARKLTYSQALVAVINHLPTIFLTPRCLLDVSPIKALTEAKLAYAELNSYMENIKDRKEVDIKRGNLAEERNILDLLVHAGLPSNARPEADLSPEEVSGNIFIFMFAGHEAIANTLTFLLTVLACHPCIQKRLQQDIDDIVGPPGSSSTLSSYDEIYALISEGMVGAVINETLRLFPVLPLLPKKTPKTCSQPFTVSDHTRTLPQDTLVLINTSALHRHPKSWPRQSREHKREDMFNPVASFDPDSWLVHRDLGSGRASSRLLQPQNGSFIPFSDGSRGCLGRKFALVELCGVITRMFSEYSVELALEETKVPGVNENESQRRWEAAKENAEYQLSARVEFKTSLRLKGTVPLNFVRRKLE